MSNRMAKALMLAMASLFLAGCPTDFINEGAMKVRFVSSPPPSVEKNLQPSKPHTVKPPETLASSDSNDAKLFQGIYFPPGSKNVNRINKGEYFSVSLLSAYICDVRESRNLDVFTIDGSNPSGNALGNTKGCTYGELRDTVKDERITRGEISIIVNVGEISNTKNLSTNPTDTNSKGRVIYYNDDIRESGQLLNAINLPIYGPKKYEGKNFFFDLWMLELDNEESQEVKELLGSLADLGGKAYPPSAPILGLLNTLGGAFLSGEQDDVEARFQMRFDVPAPATSSIFRLPLAEGYYAFVREENRDLNPEWTSFMINESDGELCVRDAKTRNCKTEKDNTYRNRTWFLVRVAKESRDSALDIEYGEVLSTFLERVDKYDSDNYLKTTRALSELEDDLKSLVCKPSKDVIKKTNSTCPSKVE